MNQQNNFLIDKGFAKSVNMPASNGFEYIVSEIKKQLNKSDIQLLDVSKIEYDFLNSQFVYDGFFFSKNAVKKFLKILSIRNKLPKIVNAISQQTWDNLRQVLQIVASTLRLQCAINYETRQIMDIWENRHNNEVYDMVKMANLVEMLAKVTPDHYDVKNFRINTNSLEIRLSNTKSTYDVLKGLDIPREIKDSLNINKDDPYQNGINFKLGNNLVNFSPYLNRIICENGAVEPVKSFGSFANSKSFTTENIVYKYAEFMQIVNASTNDFVINRVHNLLRNNASVKEYMKLKQHFTYTDSEKITRYYRWAQDIFKFDFNDFKNYYLNKGIDLEDKNIDLNTADSGINAYVLYNMATSLATHSDVSVELSNVQREALDKENSKYFYEGPNLARIVPRINIDFNLN